MNTKWLLSLVLVCFSVVGLQVSNVNAQDDVQPLLEPAFHFAHLTSDDGLVQNSIEAILQDNRGFIWIGTPAGLSRYDGYRFTTYQRDSANPQTSLSHNHIRDLYMDREGMIWIATEGGGVSRFDPQTETFTHFASDRNSDNTLGGDRVFSIFQDSQGDFWFGGTVLTGLNRFDPNTQTFTNFRRSPENPDSMQVVGVWEMVETVPGQLWITGERAIIHYDLTTDKYTNYLPPIREEGRIAALQVDSNGTLWAGGSRGLYKVNTDDGSMMHYPAFSQVDQIMMDTEGIFWIATGNGLYTFDPLTEKIIHHFVNDPLQPNSLSSNNIKRIYQDRAGVIWIGTEDHGLNLYDPRQQRFTHFRHDAKSLASISDGKVKAIHVINDHQLWIVAGDELNWLNLATREVAHYKLESPTGTISIASVYQDQSGTVWVGTGGVRVYQLDVTTGEFTEFPLTVEADQLPTTGPAGSAVAFYEDEQNTLWIASSHKGLYSVDAHRELVSFYRTPTAKRPEGAGEPQAATPTPPIVNLHKASDGNIWLATWNGFHHFDPRTLVFTSHRAKMEFDGPDSYIEAIHEDATGILWMASHDGLIRYDPNTETSKYYTETDGLSSNFLIGILADNEGNLWISSIKGLTKFNPLTETFQNFTASDGLQGNEFSERAFGKSQDGQLFFGGINGLTVFYPDQILDSEYHPSVVLTDFQLFNKSVRPSDNSLLKRPIWETDTLTLNYDQNILSFEFAALNYGDPAKSKYRYRLEGFENEWNDTDSSRHFTTYTNLPSGSYVFRVQGTNSDGTWSSDEAVLTLNILPPWWETLWFRVFAASSIAALLIVSYQWRVYSIAKRNRDLETEVKKQTHALEERTIELQASEIQLRQAKDAAEAANRAKSAFLANMSHELRSPLNAILGFAQVTNRTSGLTREVQENINIILRSGEHLLGLINHVLDLSKIEAGRITLDQSDFDLHRIFGDLEDMFILKARDKHLQLIFERTSDLPRFIYADGVKLRQILINLIGNALKFTEQGTVRIRATTLPTQNTERLRLQFEVEDTGPGIAPEEINGLFEAFVQTTSGRYMHEGTGLGLTISRKFAQLMDGDIRVKSTVGQGSTFTVQIQCRPGGIVENQEAITYQQIVELAPGQPQYRMLVVDDKWVNRQLMVKLLEPLGFDIKEAENGKEAVDMAPTFQPHLIWMDLWMPIMDGIEAVQKIKATPQGKSIVVIALTASAYDEERASVIAAGCDDFVRKPFRAQEIFDILSKHLGIRYVYDAKTTQLESGEAKPDLRGLSPTLSVRLIESIELGDVEQIKAVIAEIQKDNPALAEYFTRLANRFEYEKLLLTLREATQ